MLRKASTERVHKAATLRKTSTYSCCCITNLFTPACPPLSLIKYDAEHLMMPGSSWLLPANRLCVTSLDDTGSKWLEELCPFLFSSLNLQCFPTII